MKCNVNSFAGNHPLNVGVWYSYSVFTFALIEKIPLSCNSLRGEFVSGSLLIIVALCFSEQGSLPGQDGMYSGIDVTRKMTVGCIWPLFTFISYFCKFLAFNYLLLQPGVKDELIFFFLISIVTGVSWTKTVFYFLQGF